MKVIGIETSCDETAVAIVDSEGNILANVVRSQIMNHNDYGGVVPEIAARSHIDCLDLMIADTFKQAQCTLNDMDAIAVTAGPGLIGGVIVGVMLAKGLASAAQKPIIAVNHLEGHALTARLTSKVDFPFLLLLVSGGHCQLLAVRGVGQYDLLGSTIDDAVGEAFDKVAKMLGLSYPGGPEVEKRASFGNPKAFDLPLPLYNSADLNFSFSGLKTAVKRIVDKSTLSEQFIADICASFQVTVATILAHKLEKALKLFSNKYPQANTVVLAGGVAANQFLRSRLSDIINQYGYTLVAPPLSLCTDNGAMIAWAGLERLKLGMVSDIGFEPRSRWPLMELVHE
jgi:N6-L-threonylcarbamoyladenine synthase